MVVLSRLLMCPMSHRLTKHLLFHPIVVIYSNLTLMASYRTLMDPACVTVSCRTDHGGL